MENDGIKVKDFEFLSTNKYYMIHGKMWIPKRDVLAVVQVSHGMAEHIERYDEFARFLAKRNILVVGNDHMGHGSSINYEDDLGYFSIPVKGVYGKKRESLSSSSLAVKDLRHITRIVKKHYPGVPYILLGHSMGSFLARRYMMEYGHELDGAIIMGTGNQAKAEVKFAKLLCDIITLQKGDRHRSKLFYRLMFGNYNKRIKEPVKPSQRYIAWITSDEERLEDYEKDEKCGFVFTMNGLRALFSTIQFIEKDKNIARIPTDIKTLIMSGEDDPVGEYGKQVKEVYESLLKHGMEEISIRIYDDCRHELLNEKIRERVFRDIYEWIDIKVINNKSDE